jgi:transglutaminase superfamily protein
VGYEVEQEDRPYVFEVNWDPQENIPVREARYTLQLPPGWDYRSVWVNHAEVAPTISGNELQWVMTDLPAVRFEPDMPPWQGVAARMVVALFPPSGGARSKGFATWRDMGLWYADLTRGRRDASSEIKQKVAQLTSAGQTQEEKMRALANFIQRDIRYVGIWLGIGGWQPHSATDVFSHSFGDCKDKATLLSSMLREIGVESYYLLINTERGVVTKDMPPQKKHFDHAILAIQLPNGIKDTSLVAITEHPTLGSLLFFDPTDQTTPFGQLRGALQANFGLLVGPEGGELVELPQLPTTMNGIRRIGKFSLSPKGTLFGDVNEIRVGDRARQQRRALLDVAREADRIKPIETLLASSLSSFQITKASVANLKQNDLALGFDYSLVADSYAKTAGNLLIVRPRAIGSKGSSVLEAKEPRKYPLEFVGPSRDTDTFEITLPAGYEVDDLPPQVDVDYSFASYHSKTEVSGNTLKYTRTFEVKELSVPISKVEDLKKLYRMIAGDERNTAVLKPVAH